MRRTLIALVAAVAAAASAASLAASPTDPHQRVREMIVPPPGAASVPQGVAEYAGFVGRDAEADPHAQLRNLIRDERRLPATVQPGGEADAVVDPHRRLREMIRGD